MISKTSCQHCGQHIEFEVEHANQFAPCPACGNQTRLLFPGKQAKPPKPAVEKLTPEHAALKEVRAKTCYKTLRELIDLVAAILMVTAALPLIGSIGFLFTSNGGLVVRVMTIISAAVIFVVALALTIAARQSVLLLIDIADCQIRHATKE